MEATLDQWLTLAPRAGELAEGMEWHVFLSYRSTHRPWVIQLYDVLVGLGHNVFLDQYALRAGQPLVQGLDEGLNTSAKGILVWSGASEDSQWCRAEYESMEGRANRDPNFEYVIVLVDDIEPPTLGGRRILVSFKEAREGPRGAGLLRLLYGLDGSALPDAAVRLATTVDEETKAALDKINAARLGGYPDKIVELSTSGGIAWSSSQLLRCEAAEALVKLKKYEEALDILAKVRENYPKSIRPRQLEGLALARLGQWEEAQGLLGQLVTQGEKDPETLGIYARTWMDKYNTTKRRLHLETSRQFYVLAFDGSPNDYYTGINAAAKSVFLGELEAADKYATLVERIVGKQTVPGDYWQSATVAEVQLIRRHYREAGRLYKDAVLTAPEDIGSHESTFGQARKLLEHLNPTDEESALIHEAFAHLEQ